MAAYPAALDPTDTFKTLRETVNSLTGDIQAAITGGAMTSLSLDAGLIDILATTGQAIRIGAEASTNLIFDSNEVQARSNGAINDFLINRFGGDVRIGGATTADLYVARNIYENTVALSAKYLGISATAVAATNALQLGGIVAANYYQTVNFVAGTNYLTPTGDGSGLTGITPNLPVATDTILGGIKVGAGLTMTVDVLSADAGAGTNIGWSAGTLLGPVVTSTTGTGTAIPIAAIGASGVITTGDQTISGVKTFVSTISGSITGNAQTASTVYVGDFQTGDTNCPLLFTLDSVAGNKVVYEDSTLYYNATNGHLWAGDISATGTMTCTFDVSAGSFTISSDARLKEILYDYNFGGAKSIKAKVFNLLDNSAYNKIGYIAQEIQPLIPQAVHTNEDGYMRVDYTMVHTAKIAELEAELEELKSFVGML